MKVCQTTDMNSGKKMIKFILSTILMLGSVSAMGQIYVINADSVRLGETAGTNGISFYGNSYFKNVGQGNLRDSILVRQADGKIKFVPRSVMLSNNSVSWNNILDRPNNLSQFANGPGFVTSAGSVNYATTSGVANSVNWTNVSGRPGSLSQFSNDPGFITASGSVNFASKSGSSTLFMSSSHPDLYYLQNNWDGTWWNITSNHGAPVRVGYADVSGSVSWGNVSGRPSSLSSFTNDLGYVTASGSVNYANSAGSIAWTNVSGRPSLLSSFTNDAGYVTGSGSVNYANSAGSVAWTNVSGRPAYVSSFINDSGYLTAGGSINYANSSGSSSTAGSTTNFMSTSHAGTYFLVNNWDGARWNITSNHGAPVRVGWADGAGSVDWSNISNRPSNYAVSGGPISQFDNDYGYARAVDMTLANVTNRGSDTPNNIYLYKGGSNSPDQGSGISFSSVGGGAPTYSSIWQLGNEGAMLNLGSVAGWWEENFRINSNGDGYIRGTLTELSDIKLKKNIKQIPQVSESLRQINAVEYDRIDNKDHQIGFIAQNVQKYFPNLVKESGGEKKMLGITYPNFTVPLLKGWQEHDEVILSQKTKIKALEYEIALQKSEIANIKEALKKITEQLNPTDK
jgi:hypothetical protein